MVLVFNFVQRLINIKVNIMIQRIQTLYLIIAIGVMVAFLFVPFGNCIIMTIPSSMDSELSMTVINQGVGTIAPVCLTIGCILYAIFKYKDLTVQKGFIIFSMLLVLVNLGVVIYILVSENGASYYSGTMYTMWGLGCLLPVAALIALIAAYRGVVADQKLLRSYDRMR